MNKDKIFDFFMVKKPFLTSQTIIKKTVEQEQKNITSDEVSNSITLKKDDIWIILNRTFVKINNNIHIQQVSFTKDYQNWNLIIDSHETSLCFYFNLRNKDIIKIQNNPPNQNLSLMVKEKIKEITVNNDSALMISQNFKLVDFKIINGGFLLLVLLLVLVIFFKFIFKKIKK